MSTNSSPSPPVPTSLSPSDPKVLEELKRFEPSWKERKQVAQISLFYLLVTILVGVPLWWKTTTPYHAELPYSAIEDLSMRVVKVSVPVQIINFMDNANKDEMDSVKSIITEKSHAEKSSSFHKSNKLSIVYKVQYKQATEQQKQVYLKATEQAKTFEEFWKLFESDHLVGQLLSQTDRKSSKSEGCTKHPSIYHFFVMPQNSKFPEQFGRALNSQSMFNPVSFVRNSDSYNLIYTFLTSPSTDTNLGNVLGLHLKSMLNQVLIDTDHLHHLANRYFTSPDKLATDFINSVSQRLSVSSEYDVTMTLLTHDGSISQTDTTQLDPASWTHKLLADPVPWLKTYVEPAFKSLLPFVKINFFSQRLYAVNIEELQPRRVNLGKQITYYTKDELSTLINHLESYLGPPQSAHATSRDMSGTKPGLNIVLMLATSKLDQDNKSCPLPLRFMLPLSPAATDFAIVPQWGGLLSIDSPKPCSSDSQIETVVARKVISIIHSILGLRDPNRLTFQGSAVQPIYFVQPSSGTFSRPANWEMNKWFLRRIEESLSETNMTINSIINLLNRLPNMVIRDDVADELAKSCSSWSQTLNSLQSLDFSYDQTSTNPNQTLTCLGDIFMAAHDALASSNGAFFDHSLLGLLYFEEDQKYGIYTPLFAPFGFGLLLSTLRALRIIFKKPNS